MTEPVRVAVTGAAGQIAYSLIFRIASGDMLGPDQPVILHWLGEPWERSFHSGVVMGQVGEFSFILAALGVAAHVINNDGYRLMIAVIALSLLISPLWLMVARRLHDMAIKRLTGHLPQPSPDDL